jgi:hypothetical protein
MQKETRHYRTATIILLVLLSTIFAGCAHEKVHFLNDSELILSGDANKQPPTPSYDWILMSQGYFRKLTTVQADK